MTIKDVETATGITKQNIRFYEKKHLIRPERNENNDYRNYTNQDVKNLLLVKMLRKLDMSVEDIKKVLEQEISFSAAIKNQEKKLREEDVRLRAAITLCEQLQKVDESHIDVDRCLLQMEEIEQSGGKFIDILNDYKKLRKAENAKYFTFMPNNMCLNPKEFTLSLCEYAKENNLDLIITKESMYPEFEIDGIKYTADRAFGRFGAVIRCRVKDEMEVEALDIPESRRQKLKLAESILIIIGLLLLLLLLAGNDVWKFFELVCFFGILPAQYFIYRNFR